MFHSHHPSHQCHQLHSAAGMKSIPHPLSIDSIGLWIARKFVEAAGGGGGCGGRSPEGTEPSRAPTPRSHELGRGSVGRGPWMAGGKRRKRVEGGGGGGGLDLAS